MDTELTTLDAYFVASHKAGVTNRDVSFQEALQGNPCRSADDLSTDAEPSFQNTLQGDQLINVPQEVVSAAYEMTLRSQRAHDYSMPDADTCRWTPTPFAGQQPTYITHELNEGSTLFFGTHAAQPTAVGVGRDASMPLLTSGTHLQRNHSVTPSLHSHVQPTPFWIDDSASDDESVDAATAQRLHDLQALEDRRADVVAEEYRTVLLAAQASGWDTCCRKSWQEILLGLEEKSDQRE
ncbi:hypothetical protein DFH09DRAFT_1281423 [Mycena vulgaris]|nr:hypothetical protein DFH09DRAFT_1281423 [Mycena vulgaris]